jgi:hypothetical protein
VFDSRVLQKLFGPNRDEVEEALRKLHSEEFLVLYFSPDIVCVIEELDWACGTFEREGKYLQGFWWGNLKKGNHLEDIGIDGRIIYTGF